MRVVGVARLPSGGGTNRASAQLTEAERIEKIAKEAEDGEDEHEVGDHPLLPGLLCQGWVLRCLHLCLLFFLSSTFYKCLKTCLDVYFLLC